MDSRTAQTAPLGLQRTDPRSRTDPDISQAVRNKEYYNLVNNNRVVDIQFQQEPQDVVVYEDVDVYTPFKNVISWFERDNWVRPNTADYIYHSRLIGGPLASMSSSKTIHKLGIQIGAIIKVINRNDYGTNAKDIGPGPEDDDYGPIQIDMGFTLANKTYKETYPQTDVDDPLALVFDKFWAYLKAKGLIEAEAEKSEYRVFQRHGKFSGLDTPREVALGRYKCTMHIKKIRR